VKHLVGSSEVRLPDHPNVSLGIVAAPSPIIPVIYGSNSSGIASPTEHELLEGQLTRLLPE
jgi:hypothetical protein